MEIEFILFGCYLLLGCFAGFASGLLGIGGGLLVIPTLIFIFTHFQIVLPTQLVHTAIATSLACSIITLSLALRTHWRHHAIHWSLFKKMTPGIVIGASFIAPTILLWINPDYLVMGFGVFCMLAAVQMFLSRKQAEKPEKIPSKIILFLLSLISGTISTLLGIAGGTITGTILHYFHVNMHKIVGTSAAIGVALAISATMGLMFVGYNQPGLPAWSTGFIYWPAFLGIALPSLLMAPLGAKLTHKLPVLMLRKLFAGLLLVIGVKMLV